MRYEGAKLHTLLAGEYVLGLLRGPARRRFERLMMESRALAAEVAQWESHFASLALSLEPVEPPGYLLWRLMGRVRAESRPRSERLRNTFWRTWAVAATLLLAVIVVTERYAPPPEQKAAQFALMSDAQGKPLWLISIHPEAGRVDMKAIGPEALPAGKSYELWMIPDGGKPVPMGLMNQTGTASETVPAELLARLGHAKALAISLEPQGGSPTGQPTGPVLWVAPLVTT
ncbi:MAG TPA: anti-sigma factor [Gammaproteobacteria bacterium]|jgi:anti-sigma-K factor RskA|nr:anti-sigma factor [Gammaproteobacteria bacterium]